MNSSVIGGLNLYTYCFNDPVNYVDYGGYFPQKNTGLFRGWEIDFHGKHIPAGKPHVHVRKGAEDYAQNNDGTIHHKNRPGDPPQSVIDELAKCGFNWKVPNKLMSPNFNLPNIYWTPYGQSQGLNILGTPYNQYAFPNVFWTPYNQGTGPNIMINPMRSGNIGWIETMPWGDIGKGLVIGGAVVAGIYIAACIIGAFFTGGQSLWGLLLFA